MDNQSKTVLSRKNGISGLRSLLFKDDLTKKPDCKKNSVIRPKSRERQSSSNVRFQKKEINQVGHPPKPEDPQISYLAETKKAVICLESPRYVSQVIGGTTELVSVLVDRKSSDTNNENGQKHQSLKDILKPTFDLHDLGPSNFFDTGIIHNYSSMVNPIHLKTENQSYCSKKIQENNIDTTVKIEESSFSCYMDREKSEISNKMIIQDGNNFREKFIEAEKEILSLKMANQALEITVRDLSQKLTEEITLRSYIVEIIYFRIREISTWKFLFLS